MHGLDDGLRAQRRPQPDVLVQDVPQREVGAAPVHETLQRVGGEIANVGPEAPMPLPRQMEVQRRQSDARGEQEYFEEDFPQLKG